MKMVTISEEEYQKLLAQQAHAKDLQGQIDALIEQIRLAKIKLFAPSSEKTIPENQLRLETLFNEVESSCDLSAPEPTIEEVTVVPAHTRKKRSRQERLPADLPIEIVDHDIPEEEKFCSCCQSPLVDIGGETRDRLRIIPAKFIIERHVQHSYACKECEKAARPVEVKKSKISPALIKGGIATPESIAHIIAQKFVMGLPLYRQEQEWERHGVILSRQTMSNWILKVCENYLVPIYAALRQDLQKCQVLHADETTLQVLHEDGKSAQSKSYIWHYRTSGDADIPIVLYDYQKDRRKERPKNFLGEFKGYLHTDGYEGYHGLPNEMIIVGCMAHARRKFEDAAKAPPAPSGPKNLAKQALAYINHLFLLEKKYEDLTVQERYQKRQEEAKPILAAFYEWLGSVDVSTKSTFGKARTYAFRQRPYLENYLLDGRLELSNNRAERTIKSVVIGRKNFLFCNTSRGATATAILYSLVETAKGINVDPYAYFCWVFKKGMELRDANQQEDLAKLTPHAYRSFLEIQDSI